MTQRNPSASAIIIKIFIGLIADMVKDGASFICREKDSQFKARMSNYIHFKSGKQLLFDILPCQYS